ncbi:hypothetical protein [Candidatus Villigracilis vicinus]|uniref:hypothetical protein n=1 Tax=Candidatus Villigracilis vicinus TaxID=3140679 RepID=UPI0031E8D7F7
MKEEVLNIKATETQSFRQFDLKRKSELAKLLSKEYFCSLQGILSILATVAIVYELGKEAVLLFFTNPDVTLPSSSARPNGSRASVNMESGHSSLPP